jgi:CHAT domain-containing protein
MLLLDEALARADAAISEGSGEERPFSAPYHWAAFTYSGAM